MRKPGSFGNIPRNSSSISPAEQMLPGSTEMRGLGGMNRTSAPPGPNAYDQGGASKPSVNTQPYNNERLALQNQMIRKGDAVSQAQADAVQGVRKQQLLQDNQDYNANAFASERKAEVMEVLGSPATQYMSQMGDIEGEAFRKNIATGKAMAIGVNPDLADGGQVDFPGYKNPGGNFGFGGRV